MIRIFPSSVTTAAGRTLAEKNTASILGYIMDHRAVLSGFTYNSSTATTISITEGRMLFDGYQIEVPDTTSVGYYDTIYDESVSAPVVGDIYYLVCFLIFQNNVNSFLQTVIDETATGENIFRIIPANFYVANLQNKETYIQGGYQYKAQALYSFTYAASINSSNLTDLRNFIRFDPHTISTGWFENMEFITGDSSFNTEFTISNAADPATYFDKAAMLSRKGAGAMDMLDFLYDYVDFVQTGIRGLPSLKRGAKTFSQQYDNYNTFDSNQNRDDCLPLTTETYGDTDTPSVYNKLRYRVMNGETQIRGFDFINSHIKYSGVTGAVSGDLVTLDAAGFLNALYLPKATAEAFGVLRVDTAVKEGEVGSNILSVTAGVLTCNAPRYAFKTFAVNVYDYSGSQVGNTVNVVANNNNSTLTLNYGSGLTITPNNTNRSVGIDVSKVLTLDTLLLQNGGVLNTTGNKGVAIRFNSTQNNNTILNPSYSFVKNSGATDTYVSALSMLRDGAVDLIQVGNITTPINIKSIDTLNVFCSNTQTPSTDAKMTLTSTLLTVLTDLTVGTSLSNKNIFVNGDIDATGRVHQSVWNDYAELFEKEDVDEIIEPGDVVSLSKYTNKFTKCGADNADMCVGVCSDTYGHLLGGTGNKEFDTKNFVPVGVSGRVSVKVYGPLMKGDLLMACSFIPGVALKADKEFIGRIIGKSLEDKNSLGIGKIKMMIMLG